jgi:hypothetical protein
MTTTATSTSTALAAIEPAFTGPERMALAGFLAGYTGLTREAYGLDRNEVGALLVAAGLGPAPDRALISLLALNGLGVSEATGANIEAMGIERGHRTVVITRIRAGRSSPSRSPRALPERLTSLSGNAAKARSSSLARAAGWTGTPPAGSSAGTLAAPESQSPSARTR